MAVLGLRFDFRNPAFAGTTMAQRYAGALEMAEWADELGFATIILSEHHGSDDGYLPSALTMAAAIAARTRRVRISVSAVVAALHDPLRLAEDAAVVDQLSGGRLDLVVTGGYVASEFTMFGRSLRERAERTTETVETLRRAWTGAPFTFRGRPARITPMPVQPGGPPLSMGGSVEAAARRAARLGVGFLPTSPDVWEFYREEVIRLGRPDPGPHFGGDTSFFHLDRDPDAGWQAVAPFALHEVNAYGAWMEEAGIADVGGYSPVADAEALRATGQYRVLTPEAFATELAAKGPAGFAMFHPLMGGIPPALAWESLRLFEREVLPALGSAASTP